jgi:DNA-binding NtrC family response regulator
MPKRVLIVEDDSLMRSFLSTVLREEGHQVEEASNAKEALSRLSQSEFDLVLSDLRMPGLSGLDLLQRGRKEYPETRWILITAYGSIESAVDAMKAGASDYLTKPLRSPEELRHVVRRVLREAEAETRISLLSEEMASHAPPLEMIFLGDRMEQVQGMVREVAPTPATILIAGASGTGKELIARAIHRLSPRRDKPFIAVHCAALAENLLESELFGHERGAFTGAISGRKGRFELADGGTVFLDEVGEISPLIQVKLLRVLQERAFERVGGTKLISVDVRVISATNRDLKADVSTGRFRSDLFYRLNVFPVALPTLAERREAILPLAGYFLKKFATSFGKKVTGFTAAAEFALLGYPWPGNIRELQNVIERAVILSDEQINLPHLNLDAHDTVAEKKGLLWQGEREIIEKTLAEVGGNRKMAAEILGISLRTLQYRIKEYGI